MVDTKSKKLNVKNMEVTMDGFDPMRIPNIKPKII
jgi:hypothetical protein